MSEPISIRPLKQDDVSPLTDILHRTGVFTPDEVGVAVELMNIYLNQPRQRDYELYTALTGNMCAGYTCFGPTPLTTGTFDLYWIAVDPNQHNKGIGKSLLRHAEEVLIGRGGRLIVAETSSQPKYKGTRMFYDHSGYRELARIRDYYKPGDDLVVYGRYISHNQE